MKISDWFKKSNASQPMPEVRAQHTGGVVFNGLDDPRLLEYIRDRGGASTSALFNTTAYRCVELISSVMGALPFRPMKTLENGKIVEDVDHPLYEVLNGQANAYQTGSEFRQLMQARVLVEGDAYARIVRSGSRVVAMLPLEGVSSRLNVLGEPVYTGANGVIPTAEIFHLRDFSLNGINGMSRVRQAARAIGLSKEAEDAAISIFRGGMSAGGKLKHPSNISEEAGARLKKQMSDEFAGGENAGKWMLLEEGMDAEPFQATGRDSQLLERSKHQVEEIARVFGGVPRPLLCVDDTSWGSGIEQLAILFVRFTLFPWFNAWERRGRMSLLTAAERRTHHLDYDERELLRGSLKDQAEFFSKALGGPGTKGWMEANEVRELSGLGTHADGKGLADGKGQPPILKGNQNDTAQAA